MQTEHSQGLVTWRGYFQVKSRTKAEKVLERVVAALNCPVQMVSCAPYWKDKSLYEVIFTTAVDTSSPPHACYAVLELCQRLGSGWYVFGPDDGGDRGWRLEGIQSHPTLPGVTWICFNIDTIPPADPHSPL